MKLFKYVDVCAEAMKKKISEDKVISYAKVLIKKPNEYNDLATRLIFDVANVSFKLWKELSEEDYRESNNGTIKTLYFTAFKKAYPEAWKLIQSTYSK